MSGLTQKSDRQSQVHTGIQNNKREKDVVRSREMGTERLRVRERESRKERESGR